MSRWKVRHKPAANLAVLVVAILELVLEAVAQRKQATPTQIALTWVLVQKNVASAAVELSQEDLREIESATSRMTMHGARYSEAAQRSTAVRPTHSA